MARRTRTTDDAQSLALNKAEVTAYAGLVAIYREHHRMPHAHEAWPLVKELRGLKQFKTLGEPGESCTRNRISRSKVNRFVEDLMRRAISAADAREIVRGATRELGREAQDVLRNCLGDTYDANPKLLAEKRQLAVAVLKLAGLSEDKPTAPSGGNLHVHVGGALPAEEREAAMQRRREHYTATTGVDTNRLRGLESPN